MEKGIGNFGQQIMFEMKHVAALLLVVFYGAAVVAAEPLVRLRLQDMNHKPIEQVMCQAPFILQVELRNLEGYTEKTLVPYLLGMENFKSSRCMTSNHVSIDNGKKTSKACFDFVLRADKKGKYYLGPLTLPMKNGQTIRSNDLLVRVGDAVVVADHEHQEKYWLQVELDKKQAYVGQKVQLKISFYDRLFVDDLHLQFPEISDVVITKQKNGVTKKMVELQGQQEYALTQWTFDMYVQKPGALILQDIQAAFFAPALENKFKLGGAFDFFRSLHKTEQYVAAQPIKIDIMPLPEHAEKDTVHAIGQIAKYSITAQQQEAVQGQGIVVTTELQGDANFEMMQQIPLILPAEFQYYASEVVAIDELKKSKRHEYIVQANQPGVYEIEPQRFTYFDPVDRAYKMIESNGLTLTIHPGEQEVATALDQQDFSDDQEQIAPLTLIEHGALHERVNMMIPFHLYQLLILLLCLFACLFAMIKYGWYDCLLNHKKLKTWIIFYQARRACNLARSQHKATALHKIFIDLFASLLAINAGHVTQQDMVAYLQQHNFSQEQIENWQNFYHYILQVSFLSPDAVQEFDLCKLALEWIDQLKAKS